MKCWLLMASIWASADGGVVSSSQGGVTDNGAAVPGAERRVTHGPGARILTNAGVWSPDSEWLVYDTRSDPRGSGIRRNEH